jgi:hypothetical protein
MGIVKIPITKSIFKKISGKKVIKFNIKENEMEIEYNEDNCELIKEIEELQAELDAGKGIEMNMKQFEKRYEL